MSNIEQFAISNSQFACHVLLTGPTQVHTAVETTNESGKLVINSPEHHHFESGQARYYTKDGFFFCKLTHNWKFSQTERFNDERNKLLSQNIWGR